MSTSAIITVVTIFLVMDLVIVGAMLSVLRGTLDELSKSYPARGPRPEAVVRDFQSFSFDLLNLGWCVHVYADGECLHLRPAWVARKLLRMRAISIPWAEMKIDPKSTSGNTAFSARVGNVTMKGPSWCLKVALAGTGTGEFGGLAGQSDQTHPDSHTVSRTASTRMRT